MCCFPEQDDEGQKKVEELFMKLVCGYWGRDSCEWWLTDPVFGTALAGVRACVQLPCDIKPRAHGQETCFCLLTTHVAPAETAVLRRCSRWMGQC